MFVLSAQLWGCGDGAFMDPEVGEDREGAEGVTCVAEDSDPEEDVTFQMVLARVFEPGCNCHTISGGLGQVVGRLNLAEFDATLAGGVRSGDEAVVPGDPCSSVLYLKTTDTPPFGARMPFDGTVLTLEQQQMLIDWIADGALP